MNFGNPTDREESFRIIDAALDGGVNLFDCADAYSEGESERILGEAFCRNGRREEIFLTSKVFMRTGDGPNDGGNSRHHVLAACEKSLRRLHTDYIDIYFLHRTDFSVPQEETLAALDLRPFEPGALLVVVAAVSASLYMIVGKRPLRRYTALEFTTYSIWVGTLPMLVFAPGLFAQMPTATTESTVAVVFLGIFPGAVSYVLWNQALSRMPASVLATFLYFQPVNATLIAWAWLGEVPSVLAIVGGVISLSGVVVVNTMGVRRAR